MLTSLQIKDIKALLAFRTVADARGFSAAQEPLGMTQSNISSMIIELENRLGTTLCERGRGGFQLTHDGELVYAIITELQADLNIYRDRLQSVGGGLEGRLVLGHMDSYLGHPDNPLVEALSQLATVAPGIEMDLWVGSLRELESQVASGTIQIAIGTFSRELDGLRYQLLHTEDQGLYCSAEHPLAKDPAITVEKVKTAGYIAAMFGYGADAELLENPVAQVHQIESMLILLLAGRGIGALPVHVAAPYVANGQLKQLMPESFHAVEPVKVMVRPQSLSSPLVRRCLKLLNADALLRQAE